MINLYFEKESVIKLGFHFNYEFKESVKTFPRCQLNLKQKVWWGPYTADPLNGIFRFFKGRVWLVYSRFQTGNPSTSYTELPTLREVITGEVYTFVGWMRNKRYSNSTIKTYKESVEIFIRFLGNKPVDEIDNEDFKKFNQGYNIERVYSGRQGIYPSKY